MFFVAFVNICDISNIGALYLIFNRRLNLNNHLQFS